MKKLIFIDCETTGIEPGDLGGEIVELALVAEDGEVLFDRKIEPQHIETATEEAMRINGYDAEIWEKEGVLFNDVAEEVFRIIDGHILIGQHVTFDTEFLKYEIRRSRIAGNVDKISYHSIDIASIIFYCLVPPLRYSSLALACEYLGISNEGAHTALVDAQRAREVYVRLQGLKPLAGQAERLRQWPGPDSEIKLVLRDERAVRQFQKDYSEICNQKEAKNLRKGDRFSYPGSFKIYEAQSHAVADERIEGKVVLSVRDGGLRDDMRTRLDASLMCTIHGVQNG